MRSAAIALAIAWAAAAESLPTDDEALFGECEFKAAAHAFEQALTSEPGNARLHSGSASPMREWPRCRVCCPHTGTRARHDPIWEPPCNSIPVIGSFGTSYSNSMWTLPNGSMEGWIAPWQSSSDSARTTADQGRQAGSWRNRERSTAARDGL